MTKLDATLTMLKELTDARGIAVTSVNHAK